MKMKDKLIGERSAEEMLKPCPFCGGEAEIKQTGKSKMKIFCKGCHLGLQQRVLRLSMEWLEKTLRDSWNMRIPAYGLEKQIAQLKKENKFLVEWNDDKNKVDTIETLKNSLSIERHLVKIKNTQLELKQKEIDRLKDDLFTVADPDHPDYKSIKERYNT